MKRQAHEIINAHGGLATEDGRIIRQPKGVGKYLEFKINREAGSTDTWLSVEGICDVGHQPEGSGEIRSDTRRQEFFSTVLRFYILKKDNYTGALIQFRRQRKSLLLTSV